MSKKALLIITLLIICLSSGLVAAQDPFKFGVICPLSGTQAYTGDLIQKAARLAAEQINDWGGIQGQPVRVYVENDEFETPKSVAAAQKLLTLDRVHVLNGPLHSSGVHAVQRLTEQNKVPHVTSCGSARRLTEEGFEWFFRLTLADLYQTAELTRLAVEDLGLSRFAILAESGAHGQGTIDSWTIDLAKYGLEPVNITRFEDTDTDFSSQLARVNASNPDAVILAPLQPVTGATLVRQYREMGLDARLFHSSSVAGSLDYLELAGPAARGGIAPCSFLPTNPDPAVQAFVEAFVNAYGILPEGKEAAQTYDILMILYEYLNKTDEDGNYIYPLGFTRRSLADDREMIHQALTTVQGFNGATGIEVNFGPEATPEDRDGVKTPLIAVVVDGEWVPIEFVDLETNTRN